MSIFTQLRNKQLAARAAQGDLRATATALREMGANMENLTAAELAYLDGLTPGTSSASKAMVRDASNLMDGVPVAESQSVDPSQKFTLFEDFHGTWLATDAGPVDNWTTTAGSGTANAAATTVANSINGEVTITTSSANASSAADASNISGQSLAFMPTKGGLVMEAKLQIDDIANGYIFVGFSDVAAGTVERPIFLTAADIDSDADNACGVCFDSGGTTEQWFHGGVAATVDTVPAYSGGAPVNDTYDIVRVEVSAAGAVTGYINGVAIGTAVAAAITAATAVTPTVVVSNSTANTVIMTLDYIWAQQDR